MKVDTIINKLTQLDPEKDSLHADLTIQPRRSGFRNFLGWVVYIFTCGLKAKNQQLDDATKKIINIVQPVLATLSTLQRDQLESGLSNLKKVITINGGSKAKQIDKLREDLASLTSPRGSSLTISKGEVNKAKEPAVLDKVDNISNAEKTKWFSNTDFDIYFDFLHSLYDFHSYTKGTVSLQPLSDADPQNILLIDAVKLARNTPSAWIGKKPLVYPLLINENHWVLVYIDREKREIEYYNSFSARAPHQLKEVCNFFNQNDPGNKKYIVTEKVRKKLQHDGFQCGPWAAHFAEERLKDPQFVPGSLTNDVARFRSKMLSKNASIKNPIGKVIKKMANLYRLWDFYKSGRQATDGNLEYVDANLEALLYGAKLNRMEVLTKIKNNHFLNPITDSLCHFPNGLPKIDTKRTYTRIEAEEIINLLQLRELKEV